MNQEQNNFNTQGNNEIPNNQNLNNNFYQNHNMYQNANGSGQPFSSQPQTTPNYGQSVESNNVTSKPPKKNNLALIIGVVTVVVVILISVLLLLSKSTNNETAESNNNETKDNNNSITEGDTSKYNLEIDTIWINTPLEITYNIPKQISGSMLNGSSSFTYMHGSSFSYYNGYNIYVDKSLEGHTDLNTLASDIIGEKNSNKYKNVYQFGSDFLTEFDNKKTENIKIGNTETVYFESEELSASSVVGNELKIKIVGYSFKYNNDYISVYGELLIEEESKLEYLKQMLQYIINSIKKHNGESIQELGGNVKNYYDDGYTNNFVDEIKTKITINHLSSHTRNGVLRTMSNSSDVVCSELYNSISTADAYLSWNKTLDGIFDATKNTKYDTFGWRDDSGTIEILNQEQLKINGIDMNKYLVKYRTGTKGGYYVVVYTFIVDEIPYVFSYHLSNTVYNGTNSTGIYITDLTDEQESVYIAQTETVAKSFIYTIHIFEATDKITYQQYVTLFN